MKKLSWPALASVLLVLMATLGLWSAFTRGQTPAPTAQRHVLVISIDGLGASWLTPSRSQVHIPNLRRLMEEGSSAEGVVGVYPSVTYPSHTTIVTGRTPGEHGIYSNLSSRVAGKNPRDWFWFANAIKVPTLWDMAREHQLTTAAVFWPVTAGAAINWNIPEIWDPQKGTVGDPFYVAQFATPGLLFEAALELGPPKAGDDDVTRAKLAAFVLKKHKPNLLLLHLAELDEAEHRHGPASPEAAATLEQSDARIGDLLAAVNDAGLGEATDVFIVSDHGFLPVEQEINPNVLLAKAGLLTVDEKGAITGGKVATVVSGGSFLIHWPESQNLRAQVDAALKPLRDEGVLFAVLNRDAVRELGAEPAIQLALEAPSGGAFDDNATGEVIRRLPGTRGTHGYLPFRSGLEASFIAWGPQIKKGSNLRRIPMTAIGPTLLKALGINKADFGSQLPLNEIFK